MEAGKLMDRILGELRDAGLSSLFSDDRGELLGMYIDEVAGWSSRMHLVGRGDIEGNVCRLVLDSALLLVEAERALRTEERCGGSAGAEGRRREEEMGMVWAADIGSGSGFPGMIWKIARPGMGLTLFERRERPYLFLCRVIRLTGMRFVEAVMKDAADYRGRRYEIVSSKAAGKLEEMLPIAEGLLEVNGIYVTVKGKGFEEETEEEGEAMRLEGKRELPGGRGTALVYRKIIGGRGDKKGGGQQENENR